MMQFTIGVLLLTFSVIVGGYQYMQNNDSISVRQRTINDLEKKQRENQRLVSQMQLLESRTMRTGGDQKFEIERMLQIGEPGLAFAFTGQPKRAGNGNEFYRHNFRISGLSAFMDAFIVAEKLTQENGFVLTRFCYGCTRKPNNAPADRDTVELEGYLYVYDPSIL